MGSVRHPKLLDAAAMESVRAAFHEIYDTIQGQNVFVPAFEDDDELKAQIIRKLLDLVSEGTSPEDFKAKVLSSLPFQ
jgi:hypothetical protein